MAVELRKKRPSRSQAAKSGEPKSPVKAIKKRRKSPSKRGRPRSTKKSKDKSEAEIRKARKKYIEGEERKGAVVVEDDGGKELYWEVEKVLARRRRGRAVQCLVRWKGFGADQDSWEPEGALCDSAYEEAMEVEIEKKGTPKKSTPKKKKKKGPKEEDGQDATEETAEDEAKDDKATSGSVAAIVMDEEEDTTEADTTEKTTRKGKKTPKKKKSAVVAEDD